MNNLNGNCKGILGNILTSFNQTFNILINFISMTLIFFNEKLRLKQNTLFIIFLFKIHFLFNL